LILLIDYAISPIASFDAFVAFADTPYYFRLLYTLPMLLIVYAAAMLPLRLLMMLSLYAALPRHVDDATST